MSSTADAYGGKIFLDANDFDEDPFELSVIGLVTQVDPVLSLGELVVDNDDVREVDAPARHRERAAQRIDVQATTVCERQRDVAELGIRVRDATSLAGVDLVYMVVAKPAVPGVLARLAQFDLSGTDLLIETPVMPDRRDIAPGETDFAAAVAGFGMLPGTLLYVYYGKVAGDLAQLASGVPTERGATEWTMLVLGLAGTLYGLSRAAEQRDAAERRARQALVQEVAPATGGETPSVRSSRSASSRAPKCAPRPWPSPAGTRGSPRRSVNW